VKRPSTADLKDELIKLFIDHQRQVDDQYEAGEIDHLKYLQRSIPVGMTDIINKAIEIAHGRKTP
jgi:hypothetical protein